MFGSFEQQLCVISSRGISDGRPQKKLLRYTVNTQNVNIQRTAQSDHTLTDGRWDMPILTNTLICADTESYHSTDMRQSGSHQTTRVLIKSFNSYRSSGQFQVLPGHVEADDFICFCFEMAPVHCNAYGLMLLAGSSCFLMTSCSGSLFISHLARSVSDIDTLKATFPPQV